MGGGGGGVGGGGEGGEGKCGEGEGEWGGGGEGGRWRKEGMRRVQSSTDRTKIWLTCDCLGTP